MSEVRTFAGGKGKDREPEVPRGYESVSFDKVNVDDYVIVKITVYLTESGGKYATLTYSGTVLAVKDKNGVPIGFTIKTEVGEEEKEIAKEGAWANAQFVIFRRKGKK